MVTHAQWECAMGVTIRGAHRPTEFSTWNTIYYAMLAINAKCIRHARARACNDLGITLDLNYAGRLLVRVYYLQTENDSSSNLTTP